MKDEDGQKCNYATHPMSGNVFLNVMFVVSVQPEDYGCTSASVGLWDQS